MAQTSPELSRATRLRAPLLNPGVQRREVWAWAMYDFANSGYTTVVLTTVFSAYFVGAIAGGMPWATLAWTAALSLSYLLIVLTMPGLGARADAQRAKRRLLFGSTLGCIAGTLCLTQVGPGAVAGALAAIVVSNYCYCVGESTTAAFLPELARPEALGRVSGWGWGWGYCGGMLTLGLSLLVVTLAERAGWPATRYVPWVLVLTCVVFGLSALPAFILLRERTPPREIMPGNMLRQLAQLWRETAIHYPQLRRLLLCCGCYQAGIAVVITLAAVYAHEVMGFGMAQTIAMVFLVNIAAAAGALLFGHLQDRLGHKPMLAATLVGWLLMVLLASSAHGAGPFWVAAFLAGLCIGSSQSAGRALVGRLAPPSRPAAFFGLWTFSLQLAATIGPLCYGLVTWLTSGNQRLAFLLTGLFFAAGLVLLARVNVAQGLAQRDAAP